MRAAGKRHVESVWEFAGPENVGGRIVDIEYDPLNPEVAYAAAATGGVFKSTDAGLTWAPVFDDLGVLTIGDLAVDPVQPNRVYVGTGEANGGHNNMPGGGIYRSTDGGLSWSYAGLEATTSIGRVLVDPLDSKRILVAAIGSYFAPTAERGVYLSEDRGVSWRNVLFVSETAGAVDLVFHPSDSRIVYAAVWDRLRTYDFVQMAGPGSAVYRSRDGGETWQRLGAGEGLPDPVANPEVAVGRVGLAVTPAEPDAVLALVTDGQTITGLWRSADQGDTWAALDTAGRLGEGTGGFSWYFGQVRVHPADPASIFALDVALMSSSDGGVGWSFFLSDTPGLHVDHHALAFHPTHPDTMLLGHDGGISRSTDGGRTWWSIPGLPITQFYRIAVDPHRPGSLLGGTQDNGTIRTVTGRLDDWIGIYGGDGFTVLVDPVDDQVLYAESQYGRLARSEDGGATWRQVAPAVSSRRANFATPVVMNPLDHRMLYYGADRIYRSRDRGDTWRPISPELPGRFVPSPRLGSVSCIAVSRADTSVIYAGTDDGRVWKTGNGGEDWRLVSDALPTRYVTSIAIDPDRPERVFVTFSGLRWRDPQPHIFHSDDGGTTWNRTDHGLPDAPVNVLRFDPYDASVLYVGTDVGVFVSPDGGSTWETAGVGLPAVSVYDLAIDAEGSALVAGTHGRSMYRLPLTGATATTRDPIPARVLQEIYPNPFREGTSVRFELSKPARSARLSVFDPAGREVDVLFDGPASAGTHLVRWEPSAQVGSRPSSGLYFFRLMIDGGRGGVDVRRAAMVR